MKVFLGILLVLLAMPLTLCGAMCVEQNSSEDLAIGISLLSGAGLLIWAAVSLFRSAARTRGAPPDAPPTPKDPPFH